MQFLTSRLPTYLPFILLSLALVAGLIWVRRVWEETHEDVEPLSEKEMLNEFEKAYAAGELDENELRRVRESINRPRSPEPGRVLHPGLRLAPDPEDEAMAPDPEDGEDPA